MPADSLRPRRAWNHRQKPPRKGCRQINKGSFVHDRSSSSCNAGVLAAERAKPFRDLRLKGCGGNGCRRQVRRLMCAWVAVATWGLSSLEAAPAAANDEAAPERTPKCRKRAGSAESPVRRSPRFLAKAGHQANWGPVTHDRESLPLA